MWLRTAGSEDVPELENQEIGSVAPRNDIIQKSHVLVIGFLGFDIV